MKIKEEIAAGGIYGDRRQQLVVIGIKMDKSLVEDLLDSCLLSDAEFALGPEAWMEMDNPFHDQIFASEEGEEEFEDDGEEAEEEDGGH